MHEGHRERLKKRFQSEGLSSFSDIQALELLLFYALPRIDTNPLAHRLLDRFGTLSNIFEADLSDIASVEGIGEHSALLIKLLPEMTRKFWISDGKSKESIATVDLAVRFIKPILFGKPVENVYIFCLDNNFCIKHYDCISQGTVNDATIYLRRVVECAMRLNSNRILVAHNHPGGHPQPSETDIRTTRAIEDALSPLGIDLVDHIVFSGHSYVSFSEQHLLGKKYPGRPVRAAQTSCEKINE
jgi:DNA repair protein RadC